MKTFNQLIGLVGCYLLGTMGVFGLCTNQPSATAYFAGALYFFFCFYNHATENDSSDDQPPGAQRNSRGPTAA